jgi:two-component system OmpR family sensor kinase
MPIDTTAQASGWSLERRLKRRLLGTLTALWLAGSLIAVIGVRIEINDVMDSALLENAQRLLAFPAGGDGGTVIDDLSDHHEPVRFVLADGSGHVLWRSQDAPPELVVSALRPGLNSEHGNRIAVQFSRDRQRIAVAFESLQDRRDALWEVIRWQLLPLLALLPLVAWTLSRVLRQGFGTLQPLKNWLAAHDLSQGRASVNAPVPEQDVPRELAPLVHTINDLLKRVGRMVSAEQAFAANSAHELRTPIAAAQAQLQRLAHEMSDRLDLNPADDVQIERIDALGRQLARLQHLCVKLMQLSRAEAGVASTVEPMDLVAIARLVMDEFNQPEQVARLKLELADDITESGSVQALGDIDALGIALRNLIENALVHSGPNSTVTVRVTHAPSIDVLDNGPGVPPEQLDKLRQPFQRGESPSPGHGLGLSIVNAIVGQMGGAFLLHSPHASGPGLHARIVLRPALCPLPPT